MALRNDLGSKAPLCAESLARDLHFLRADLIVMLGQLKFAYIPAPGDQYFNSDELC
jgi:hypothetical protein